MGPFKSWKNIPSKWNSEIHLIHMVVVQVEVLLEHSMHKNHISKDLEV